MPFLTHLNLINVILTDGSVMAPLSAATEAGNFPNLTHISFGRSKINGSLHYFLRNKWSKLQHLDLHGCQLENDDIEALATATDERQSQCILPNLDSLVISTLWIENERDIIASLFLSHPWNHLKHLALYCMKKEHYYSFVEALKCDMLPNLTQLSLSMYLTDGDQHLEGIDSQHIHLLKDIKLRRFVFGKRGLKTWCDNTLRQNLCKLQVCQSSGVREMLSEILSSSLPYLNSLILRNCELNHQDLQSLRTANVDGRLPALKHLDISQNQKLQGKLSHLLNCDWNTLISFNAEQIHFTGDEIKDLSDVKTLFYQLNLGNLSSLREIRFTTGTKHPLPLESGTQFKKLAKITVVTASRPVLSLNQNPFSFAPFNLTWAYSTILK